MLPADETGDPDATEDGPAAPQEGPAPFGAQEPTRFAADVAYRGRVGEHDYTVQARHRFLDTSFTVEIDGVAHDPKAEEKARKKKDGKAQGQIAQDEKDQSEKDQSEKGEGEKDQTADDDLRFRVEENFTVLYCTVRRPDEDGDHEDAEVIAVRTAGLGGAGEVDVRQGLTRRPLAPDQGSPSAVRDRKRTAHPTRYALLAAVTKAATFLIPLLGLGALFSGLLRPVREWVAGVVTTVIDAIMSVVDPILEWIDELLRPLREFLDELTRPVRDFISALLQPVRDLVDWLRGLLDGLSLPFGVPGWVVDVAVPVIIVLVVFAVTFRGLRKRNERLEVARASAVSSAPEAPAQADAPGGRPPAEEPARSEESQKSEEPAGSADPDDSDADAPGPDDGHGSSTP